jgi:hypothetical protein
MTPKSRPLPPRGRAARTVNQVSNGSRLPISGKFNSCGGRGYA